MKLISYAKSDQGQKRKNNEDSFFADDSLPLYVVADGMGGHEGGETASRIAVETLSQALPAILKSGRQNDRPPDEEALFAALKQAVTLANQNILRTAADNPSLSGMGTTVTALLAHNAAAYIVHVGDSRAYLLRDGMLKQLTNDHSLVADQVRAGLLTPEQAKTNPNRHVITRAVGIEEDLVIEHHILPLRRNDVFLLCTDGLTEMVENDALRGILSEGPPQTTAEKLISLANEHGGVDNITTVVLHVQDA